MPGNGLMLFRQGHFQAGSLASIDHHRERSFLFLALCCFVDFRPLVTRGLALGRHHAEVASVGCASPDLRAQVSRKYFGILSQTVHNTSHRFWTEEFLQSVQLNKTYLNERSSHWN